MHKNLTVSSTSIVFSSKMVPTVTDCAFPEPCLLMRIPTFAFLQQARDRGHKV